MCCNILVVEDEPLSRHNIVTFLQRAGHHVREADTGEAAIDLITVHDFKAVISDFRLPGEMNGLDVLKHQNQTDPGKCLILITGFGSDEVQIAAQELGAVYLEKPLSMRGLLPYI
jgi:DNA-binding response OmpR family regulator